MSDTAFSADPGPPLPEKALPAKPPEDRPPSVAKPRSSRWLLILFVLAVSHGLLALVAGGIGFGIGCALTDRHTVQQYDSVAVLPFTGEWQPAAAGENWPDRKREYLEKTLPDALSAQVAAKTSGRVKVMATHDIRNMGPGRQPRQIGRELNIRAVLSGEVSKEGRLTLQLISVGSGELLWSNTYTFVQVDPAPRWGLPPGVEAEISQAIANRLTGRGK